jgi:hypothetical protein
LKNSLQKSVYSITVGRIQTAQHFVQQLSTLSTAKDKVVYDVRNMSLSNN